MRFKNRYVLFELLCAGGPPGELAAAELAEALRAGVEAAGGALALARVFCAFKVVYCNAPANYFAVRVAKRHCPALLHALFFLASLAGRRARFRLLKVSGTVRKLEEHLLLALKAGQHRGLRRCADARGPA